MAKEYQPVTPHELLRGLEELEKEGVNLPKSKESLINEVILLTEKLYSSKGRDVQPFNVKLAKDKARKNLKKDSEILRKNMINAQRNMPPRTDAHHIVPAKENRPWARQYANEARSILRQWGICINHEANGVALPSSSKVPVESLPNAYAHKPVHTKIYYMNIADQLSEASSRKECLITLRNIGEELEDGTYLIG